MFHQKGNHFTQIQDFGDMRYTFHSKSYQKGNHFTATDDISQTGLALSPSDQGKVRVSAGIDYLSISTRLPNEGKFKQFMRDILGHCRFCVEERSFKIADGVYHDWTIKVADPVWGGLTVGNNGWSVYLQFSGDWWRAFTPIGCIRKLWQFEAYNCSCSRIDLRMDDWTHSLIPYEQMLGAAAQGDVAGCKKYKPRVNGEVGDGMVIDGGYFGSPKSEAYGIIYPHYWDNEIGSSQRFELQFKHKKAQEVFKLLTGWERQTTDKQSTNEEISDLMTSIVVGQFDFIDKSKGGTRSPKGINKQDCKRLKWWQQFLDLIGEGLKITVSRHKSTWQDRVNWFYRQVAKTIHMLREGLGFERYSEFIENLRDSAEERMTNQDYMMLFELEINKDKVIL